MFVRRKLCEGEPLERSVVAAIHGGDAEALKRMPREDPTLATATIGDPNDCRPGAMSRTLLHVATDYPGHFPNVAATIAALVEAGANVNARFTGPHSETPLHWAASSDDVAALDALLDAGADIEADGAVIGGGAPLADAVAFGQWRAARRLLERGAQVTLWQAAALGMLARVAAHFADARSRPSASRASADGADPSEATHAFWCACHGGQRITAEYLLGAGADSNWVGYDRLTPLDAARRSGATELAEWLRQMGARSASELPAARRRAD